MSTMMRILIVILGSFGCCWVNAQSQDHQPAPMMTQPYAEKKKTRERK